MKHVLLTAAAAATLATGALAQEITLGRFFGACEDAGTDTTTSVGEACIIQSIINAADAELDGIIDQHAADRLGQLLRPDQGGLCRRHAAGRARHAPPPDSGICRVSARWPISRAIWRPPASTRPTGRQPRSTPSAINGGIYGVPMDFHANLWHVNMDMMDEAGLVADGKPVLPSSPEELLAHAKQVKDATGKDYLAADFAQFPIGVRAGAGADVAAERQHLHR